MDNLTDTLEFLAIDGTPHRIRLEQSKRHLLKFNECTQDLVIQSREEGWPTSAICWIVNALCDPTSEGNVSEEDIDRFLNEKGDKTAHLALALLVSTVPKFKPSLVEYDAGSIVAQMQALKVNEVPPCPEIFRRSGTGERLGKTVEGMVRSGWRPGFIAGSLELDGVRVSIEGIAAYMKHNGIGADLLDEKAPRDPSDLLPPENLDSGTYTALENEHTKVDFLEQNIAGDARI